LGNFSKRLGKRVLHKGPEKGYCTICGVSGKLSRDHVPPKKCNNLNDVEISALLPSEEYSKIGTTSQGGTHFRTLCSKCNSERLGLEYDPALIGFSNEITALAIGAKERQIHLPQYVYPIIKPQRVARSVIGHVLAAAAIEEIKTGPLTSPMSDAMREYFLDSSAPMPEMLDIYYWIYPSNKQVVIKYFGKAQFGMKATVTGHVIKFLPLGFWLVWDKPKSVKMNIPKLVKEKGMGLDDREQLKIDLYNVPSTKFPEAPKDWEINLLNDKYAYVGNPKT